MGNERGQVIIRKAAQEDAFEIARICVEDWQKAYRGIIADDHLDAMSAEKRYERELERIDKYTVAADGGEILGFAWNELTDDETADCEIVALYVRYSKRGSGIGTALFGHAVDTFRAAGRKRMIVWCLGENREARKFYEKMGGKAYKTGTHRWGDRDYDMISYLYQLDRLPSIGDHRGRSGDHEEAVPDRQ